MSNTIRALLEPCPPDTGELDRRLSGRRRRFGFVPGGAAHRFPVMAALVPVATSRGGEVAYPGDPMCLYAALTLTIQRSATAPDALLAREPSLDDVLPDWGHYPDDDYRRAEHGYRTTLIADNPTTDGHVFDPRVWDDPAREQFVAELIALRPRVVLLSAVSAGHRYALEMAALAKTHSPGCVVVIGGRHADETVRYQRASHTLDLSWSSTVAVIGDGRSERVIDFVVAGDGAPGLDLLLQAVSLVLPAEAEECVDTAAVLDALPLVAGAQPDLTGAFTVVGILPDGYTAVPVQGRRLSSAELPSPYEAFSVRARFGIFTRADSSALGSRTAHMLTLDACPFKCTFCSESIQVSQRPTRFAVTETEHAAERLGQMMDWGAEAAFFDDPVFWGGNWRAINNFCRDFEALRAARGDERPFEWGAQLTVDVVLNRAKSDEVAEGLDRMARAGCSYIYIGIESMAQRVMAHVGKNLLRRNPETWVSKVREALDTIRSHGIRVGSSVLFGLDGENRETIQETIEEIGRLIDDKLLIMASPNILTYHPGTAITAQHGQDRLDYHSRKDNRPPFTYFEEAYPEVISKLLTEDDIWYIHEAAAKRWGSVRNSAAESLTEAGA
ncbi:B12-binding domain-containing radical SAM protein [Streptantibioticus silvisoli]|uniref:B12-binding domain-containing radical SAM protein n=1 Tax=Streptantibioticus silvisoli TaxID=2705255 RepID=A0ABT6W5I9_9ACTN|nr:B12-binding domain-containing radical SAM protein [Streptantibioticus silvisoli]MDI5966022.1 B12-binding domain-containing radical SAM protein [Streptantibioticus silvisoli]